MTTQGVTNIVIAGLGGQGVLKASDILADAAFRAGYDVKKAEVHGMSQRGGSVTSDVRFGGAVLSPMVPAGEADILVVLEPTQADPNRHILREGGLLLSAEALDLKALPTQKTVNTAMLGMLSRHIAIPEETLLDAVRAAFPETLHAANTDAFAIGKQTAITGDRP
jgi:indolepyruvate ferredoxin oxidoreductase, beta subunit